MPDSLQTFQTIPTFRTYRATLTNPIALVPTMGALHTGHASLVRAARQRVGTTGAVIASIFVNPTQFAANEDFSKYPRTLEDDLELLIDAGADAAFVPRDTEIYPAGAPLITVDPGPLGAVLEGKIRPGHFAGVCTVVLKLLNIIQPTELVMGAKDFQQNAVLIRMIADLNVPTKLIVMPTIRAPDGLALSSRNRYLPDDLRPRAVGLYEALAAAENAVVHGERDAAKLNTIMTNALTARGLEIQYALVVNSETLTPYTGPIAAPAVALIAAKLGTTRLIDNMVLLRAAAIG
jgi:pantoate--beta-alanine ligase